jgi:hypothetical protein
LHYYFFSKSTCGLIGVRKMNEENARRSLFRQSEDVKDESSQGLEFMDHALL